MRSAAVLLLSVFRVVARVFKTLSPQIPELLIYRIEVFFILFLLIYASAVYVYVDVDVYVQPMEDEGRFYLVYGGLFLI